MSEGKVKRRMPKRALILTLRVRVPGEVRFFYSGYATAPGVVSSDVESSPAEEARVFLSQGGYQSSVGVRKQGFRRKGRKPGESKRFHKGGKGGLQARVMKRLLYLT
jgi:hypothetical protein